MAVLLLGGIQLDRARRHRRVRQWHLRRGRAPSALRGPLRAPTGPRGLPFAPVAQAPHARQFRPQRGLPDHVDSRQPIDLAPPPLRPGVQHVLFQAAQRGRNKTPHPIPTSPSLQLQPSTPPAIPRALTLLATPAVIGAMTVAVPALAGGGLLGAATSAQKASRVQLHRRPRRPSPRAPVPDPRPARTAVLLKSRWTARLRGPTRTGGEPPGGEGSSRNRRRGTRATG